MRERHGDLVGVYGRGVARPTEYRIWHGMLSRCNNPRAKGYQNYGGRGIRVCEAWRHSYSTFLADVGRRPSLAHTLHRVNNDGHYEPGNVRWATWVEQRRNARRPIGRTQRPYWMKHTWASRRGGEPTYVWVVPKNTPHQAEGG